MSIEPRRVALLARPGVASDRLGEVLAEAGVERVLLADPTQLDTPDLLACDPQVVLVALDAATEDVLDRFDAVLGDPGIDVIYEEADLAAAREGWDAARWKRHLIAKLQGHADVLPPGTEAASEHASVMQGGAFALQATEAESALPSWEPDPFAETVAAAAPPAAAYSAFDPVNAESTDFSFDGYDLDFALPDQTGADDAGGYRHAGNDADDAAQLVEVGEADFSTMFDAAPAGAQAGEFADTDDDNPDDDNLEAELAAALEATTPGSPSPRAELSLDDGTGEGFAATAPSGTSTRFQHDLEDLDRRISSMELVDDTPVRGPDQPRGAVLVMAGIGGPDAVRQLLSALPGDFPRPVLVRQRLDGGRYDKLVAQMQRATTLPVKLADVGLPAIAGVVYIVPPELGLTVSLEGMRFSDDGDLLTGLPSSDSAVLLLSGSDALDVDTVMNHGWAGALVIGQSPDGCYDAAAPSELAARGGDTAPPTELAQRLAERWPG